MLNINIVRPTLEQAVRSRDRRGRRRRRQPVRTISQLLFQGFLNMLIQVIAARCRASAGVVYSLHVRTRHLGSRTHALDVGDGDHQRLSAPPRSRCVAGSASSSPRSLVRTLPSSSILSLRRVGTIVTKVGMELRRSSAPMMAPPHQAAWSPG